MSDRRRVLALRELHVPTQPPRHNLRSERCKLRRPGGVVWQEPCAGCNPPDRRCVECNQPWPCRTMQVLQSPDDRPAPAPTRDEVPWPDLR